MLRILAALRSYDGRVTKRKGWPFIRPLRAHAGFDITKAERKRPVAYHHQRTSTMTALFFAGWTAADVAAYKAEINAYAEAYAKAKVDDEVTEGDCENMAVT